MRGRPQLRFAVTALLGLAVAGCWPAPAERAGEGGPAEEPEVRVSHRAPRGEDAGVREPVLLPGPGARLYGVDGVPSAESRAVAGRASERLGERIQADRCLERAAEILLELGGASCRLWPAWVEEPVLHHAGCFDTAAYSMLFCSDHDGVENVYTQLDRALERIKDRRLTHLGVGRLPGRGYRWTYAVLLVPRRLELGTFPRKMGAFSVASLEGNLTVRADGITAFRMDPYGKVFELPVDRGRDGQFSVPVAGPGTVGRHWLELMVSDARGPHVAALFPVYVDMDPPRGVDPPPPIDLEARTPEEAEVVLFELVNLERGQRGLPLLSYDPFLAPIARKHARAMRDGDFFAHVDPAGRGPRERAAEGGYRARILGENLARAPDATAAHRDLMGSPAHRANLLDPRFTHVGIGVVLGRGPGGRLFWVVEELSLPQREVGAEEAALEAREGLARLREERGLWALSHDLGLERVAERLARRAADLSMNDLNEEAKDLLAREGVAYRTLLLVRQLLADPADIQPFEGGDLDKERFGIGVEVREGEGNLEYVVILLLAR